MTIVARYWVTLEGPEDSSPESDDQALMPFLTALASLTTGLPEGYRYKVKPVEDEDE